MEKVLLILVEIIMNILSLIVLYFSSFLSSFNPTKFNSKSKRALILKNCSFDMNLLEPKNL